MENSVIQFSFPSEALCGHEITFLHGRWAKRLGEEPWPWPSWNQEAFFHLHPSASGPSFVTDSDVWPKYWPFCVLILHWVKPSSLHLTCRPHRSATGNVWDHLTRSQYRKMERIMPQIVRHLTHWCLYASSGTLCIFEKLGQYVLGQDVCIKALCRLQIGMELGCLWFPGRSFLSPSWSYILVCCCTTKVHCKDCFERCVFSACLFF